MAFAIKESDLLAHRAPAWRVKERLAEDSLIVTRRSLLHRAIETGLIHIAQCLAPTREG